MNTNAFTLYRALHYAWRKCQPVVRVSVNGREYKLKPITLAGLLNAKWQAGWKAHLLSHLLPLGKGAFIDVGANVGQTLLDFLATSSSAPCYLFEPNPNCVVELNSIVAINRIENCKVVPIGLSDTSGPAKLFLAPSSPLDQGASLIENLRPNRQFEEVTVPCFRFDDIYTAIGIENISLIKIDVEGAEPLTIAGMTACIEKFRPIILCEVLDADPRADLDQHDVGLKKLRYKLSSLSYSIFSVAKQTDGTAVARLDQVSEFRKRYFSKETAEECDYVFCPAEKSAALESSGIKTAFAQSSVVA
jgi:FkbM family methyltransferase